MTDPIKHTIPISISTRTDGEGSTPQDPWPVDENPSATASSAWKKPLTLTAMGIGLIALWLTSRVSYLLFHSLVEVFSVLVAWGMFIVAWNTRRFMAHGFFLFLGIAFLAVGALDFLHLLAYKGMGVFPKATADLPTQLWIAARYLEAGSLLLAPVYLTRRVRAGSLLSIYGLVTALMLAAVFGGWFPACFVEGQGLTPFKVASEYLICGMLGGGILFVYRRRQYLDRLVVRLVIAALGLSIATELAFTLYSDVYGLFNQIGHILKIMAFFLLYKGVIETGLRRPFRTLFLDLAQGEKRYRKLFDTMTEGFALHEIITDEQGRPCDYRFIEANQAFERLTGLKQADLIGRRVLEVLPDTEPYWIETYGRVVLTGEPAHFENYAAGLDRWYEVLAYRTEPGIFAVIFTDITGRKRNEEALQASRLAALNLMEDAVEARHEAEKISTQLEQASHRLKRAHDELEVRVAERTLELEETMELVKAERKRFFDVLETLPAYLVLLTPDYQVPFANRFFRERFGESGGLRCYEYLFGRSEPCEICETFTVLKTGAPHEWEWTGPDGRDYAVYDFPFTDRDSSTLILEMGIDVTERNQAEAQLKESEQRVRFFAAQCLTTQEQERKRIAAELHDSLASSLVAVKYRLEKAAGQMGPDAPESFEELITILEALIREVRRIMVDLRPAVLDDLGIIPALNWFCREFEKTYGHIRVEKQTEVSESQVAEALKTPIFRLTQEALNNIAKHSGASLVTLSLVKVNSRIALTIRDNGRGFDLDDVVKGLGLSTMKERTELSGGEYRLESVQGEGTVLFASWPLAE